MTENEYLTITLSGRRPVRIRKDHWPVITSGRQWNGEFEAQADRAYYLTIRKHADGRAIIYGRYETRWQGEHDIRAGMMLQPTTAEKLEAAIHEIAGEIGLESDDHAVRECLAGLPAEELDHEITMDEAAARC
jgi:hypothetical protein